MKLLKELARREILVPHLDNWFARAQFPDELTFTVRPNKEKDDAFHPSSATDCVRAQYAKIKRLKEGNPLTASSHKTFMVGHWYHDIIQHIVVDLGFADPSAIEREYVEHRESPNGNKWWMRGFADIAELRVPKRDETYLVDVKTMNARAFAEDDLPKWARWKYTVQCNLYMHWHKQTKCIILCAEKDSPHRFKEILLDYDPAIVEGVYESWDTLADALADGFPPECNCLDPDKCPAPKGMVA